MSEKEPLLARWPEADLFSALDAEGWFRGMDTADATRATSKVYARLAATHLDLRAELERVLDEIERDCSPLAGDPENSIDYNEGVCDERRRIGGILDGLLSLERRP